MDFYTAKGTAVPLHIMKEYGSGGTTPLFLTLVL